MAKRILSISYDPSLLLTRKLLLQQLGYFVVSAEGFAEVWDACESGEQFSLIIVGHSVPPKDKARIIAKVKMHSTAPIMALLRPNESSAQGADYSVDADVDAFLPVVRKILESDGASDA